MTTDQILALAFRWAHILAAITGLGGAIFIRYALTPVLAALPDDQRRSLHEAIRSRWAKFVHMSIGVLLLTGLYNFMVVIGPKNVPPGYHMIFGIKFLLALGVFFTASILVGRSGAAQRARENAKTWLLLNIGMAITIVCLSGYLRLLRDSVPAKKLAPPASAAQSTTESATPAKPVEK